MFDMQAIACARPLAWDNAGKSKPARMAMIAMTTSSSMSVKPPRGGGSAERRPIVGKKMAALCRGAVTGKRFIALEMLQLIETTALITPVSGLIQSGNAPINSAKLA